jgi:molybdopterin-biosynthesis enzyme MoeA-like protein
MFFTPGVPSEFKVMVEQEILPRLRQRFTLPEPPVGSPSRRQAVTSAD